MDSSMHTVKILPLPIKKEKGMQECTKILSSRINFEDPTTLLQTRTLLANFIRENQNKQSSLWTKQ